MVGFQPLINLLLFATSFLHDSGLGDRVEQAGGLGGLWMRQQIALVDLFVVEGKGGLEVFSGVALTDKPLEMLRLVGQHLGHLH